ncbi:tetratricopeptide repeat protein [Aggregicoccus sp. 17bor-14]|uniref:tetratricopeptide repeat protein n=1 Tax=Myxococcaceae TaxID=31 RepID=UPI00129C477A|nr:MULTISPECIES: tetratricopeptide repeat protein [Myxococcaceae]MBF5042853.1 zinc-ribbon domain-containing protein [Simulacricoccus sp. 17bor-14]MRI88620.1 tetratricopeptide repeat protein [Aggregicoccus sp. 17bor-14]
MKVSCPSCQTNYNIDDKRIPPGGAKLKCARCQNTFPIRPASESAGAAVPLPGANPFAADAVPLPASAGGPSDAVPLPGNAYAAAPGAIPLPGAPAPAGEDWDAESTRVMTMPVPPAAFGESPAAVPLPGAGRARSADFGLDLPSPGAVPLPGAGGPAASGGYGEADGYGFAPPAQAVPLPGGAHPGAVPLPGGNRYADEALPLPGANPFAADALPLPGVSAPQGTARDFDFSEAAPPPVDVDPSALPSQDIDFADVPAAAPGVAARAGAQEMDFSSLPTPADDAFALPPPPAAAQEMDFSSLPTPASEAYAPPAAAPRAAQMDFSSLPTPADEVPMASDLDFSEAPAPDPTTGFGDVDFSEPPPPPARASGALEFDPTDASHASKPASPEGLEMLSFIDEGGAARAAAGGSAQRFHVRRRSGKVFGPFDEAAVVKMLEDGQLLGNEDVSLDAESWAPIGTQPGFAAAIQRLMEAPASGSGSAAGSGSSVSLGNVGAGSGAEPAIPNLERRDEDPSLGMDRLKQLYEGRMAAAAMVDGGAGTARLKRRLPVLLGAGALGLALLAGASLGLTRYGAFGVHRLFPARVSEGSGAAAELNKARQALLGDTFASYKQAKALSERVLAVKEYPEVRALWCQAVFYLQRRYAAATPADLARAQEALPAVEMLGAKDPEVVKAFAGQALVQHRPEDALPALQDAWSREGNRSDVELAFLLAEAYAQKGQGKDASEVLKGLLAQGKPTAKALHALGDLHQAAARADEAARAYDAALKADPRHAMSAVELAAVELLVRKDVAKGEAAVERALEEKVRAELGPAELARALTLRGVVRAQQFKPKEAQAEFEEALKKDPQSVFTKVNLARVLLSQREYAAALPLYKEAATREPRNIDSTDGYIRTLVATGNMGEALDAVKAANARFPDNARIAYLFGRIDDARGESASAETHYTQALASDADLVEARLYLARHMLRANQLDKAKEQLALALKVQPDSALVHTGLGELALASGEGAAAREAFEHAVSLDPNLADAHLGLSRQALAAGELERAKTEADRALELDPRLKEARLHRGRVLWRQGALADAVTELEAAKAEDPRAVAIPVMLGAVKLQSGDLAGAESNLLLALRSEPSNAEALYYLAQVKAKRAEYTQALDSMRSAVERAPKRADYHYTYGLILRDAKKLGEAMEEWKTAVKLDPASADAHEALGQGYLERGDVEAAVGAFEASLKADPKRTRVIGSIGDVYFNAARWSDAVAQYQTALKQDPSLTALLYKVGRAYSEQADHAKAVEWYKKAIVSDAQNPMPYYYLGFAYKEKGKKREAIAAFKDYLSRRPDAEDKKDIEDEIYDLEH